MAQAPRTMFRGAVSLGFCPDLEVKRRFCGTATWHPGWDEKKKQSWLPEDSGMSERTGGGTRWFALQGLADQVCAPAQTVSFVEKVPHAKVVALEKVGHGFSVPSRWGAEFDRSVSELLERQNLLDPEAFAVHQDGDQSSPQDVAARLRELHLPLE